MHVTKAKLPPEWKNDLAVVWLHTDAKKKEPT